MHIIDIRHIDKVTFIRYLGHNLCHQPNINDIKRFYAQLDNDDQDLDDKDRMVLLTPWIGEHHWHHNGETLTISIQEEGKPLYSGGFVDYYHRIQVSHTDLGVLSAFMKEALSYTKPIKNQQIKIYYSISKGYWEHFNNMYAQPFSKVYVDPAVKDTITHSIDSFIASKQRYIDFGRPYKLNFLLTGVPGSGKTSTVKAIALKYGRPVYVLSFSKNLTDETLVDLMREVKDNSIILMEDIDAFFVERESKCNINVSFSALLNIMDGTMMKGNGTMIFLTANNPDRLDTALIRPGRIDHVIRYDYPRQQEIKEAFKDITSIEDDAVFTEFYKKIKNLRVTMSCLVDFLFRFPNNFMEHIGELVTQTQIRADIANDKTEKMYV